MSEVNSLTLYANEVLKGQLFDSWQHTRVFTYEMSHFSSVQIFVLFFKSIFVPNVSKKNFKQEIFTFYNLTNDVDFIKMA